VHDYNGALFSSQGNHCMINKLEALKAELQKAVNERNEAWFQLEEAGIPINQVGSNQEQRGSTLSFEGVAEIAKIDGFDMIAVNGDGVMISTDNVKPNAVELVTGKLYKISVKEVF
jgi:hypothetical protein